MVESSTQPEEKRSVVDVRERDVQAEPQVTAGKCLADAQLCFPGVGRSSKHESSLGGRSPSWQTSVDLAASNPYETVADAAKAGALAGAADVAKAGTLAGVADAAKAGALAGAADAAKVGTLAGAADAAKAGTLAGAAVSALEVANRK